MTLVKTNFFASEEFQMKHTIRRSKQQRHRIRQLRDSLHASKQSRHLNTSTTTPKRIRHRRHSAKLFVLNPDGSIRKGEPSDSTWWVNYVILPEDKMNARHKKKFRDRFRMPYDEWKKFVDKLNENEHFDSWKRGRTDALGRQCCPIELLILGVLRKLGRDMTFDDLEEITYISERTHRSFFKKFILYGSTVLFNELVVTPTTKEDAANHVQ